MANKFGALESVQQMSLSPDGTKIAFVTPLGGTSAVLKVADLSSGSAVPKSILLQRNEGETLRGCRWATDTRLVCRVSTIINWGGYLLPFTRLFAVSSDGSDFKMLTGGVKTSSLGVVTFGGSVIDWDLPGKPGRVLVMRQYVPDENARVISKLAEEGIGVEEIDVTTLERTNIERPTDETVEFISDGHGTVRIMGRQPRNPAGYTKGTRFYYYRKQGSREWEDLSKIIYDQDAVGRGFDPYAIEYQRNAVLGFDDNNGFRALYRIALDGSLTKELVLSRSDVDIDSVIQIGRDSRVVGASYATERRTAEYFDPELKKLSAALSRALPGRPAVDFVDASINEQKLLVFASSDVDPGTFYRYDKATKRLEPILPIREQLAGMAMSEMKPVMIPAADGTQVPGYLTLPVGSTGKNLPAIVMPHGGPGSRDEWGFDWLAQYFAARGYAVLQPNFRGSAGYGAAWYQKNGFQSWRTAIGDVNDAGRWLVSQGIAAPDKLGILGWSYGGYAALQSGVLDPGLFKAVVAIAPVTDLGRLKADAADYSNAPLVNRFVGNGPHIREGSPAQNAEAFTVPVLMFHGSKDLNVSIGQSRLMATRLRGARKEVNLVEFPGLDHQLGDGAARARMLSESDAFLRQAFRMAP